MGTKETNGGAMSKGIGERHGPAPSTEGSEYRTLTELAVTAMHQTRMEANSHLFWRNERFSALFLVRSGVLKTYNVDLEGGERVRGFHFSGELLGMDGIAEGTHRCHAVALETSVVHRLPFRQLIGLTTRSPVVQAELFRFMSREFGAVMNLAGDYTAEQRVAGFLLDMSRRCPDSVGGDAIVLAMPRCDIANYLRLATETVSRTFTQFRHKGMIQAHGRHVELRDMAGLREIAEPTLSN